MIKCNNNPSQATMAPFVKASFPNKPLAINLSTPSGPLPV